MYVADYERERERKRGRGKRKEERGGRKERCNTERIFF